MKIISLVPSITETLIDFSLTNQQIIGRTKFCIHPKNIVQNIKIVGGTKTLHLDTIKALEPDLIIANKEENTKEQIEILKESFPVMVTNIGNIEDNYYFLKNLGQLLHQDEKAKIYNSKTYEVLLENKIHYQPKVAYLIWKNPWMTIGGDTFIHDVLQNLGFQNIFASQKRYPIIQLEDLHNVDIIMLSSEPFPFKEKHILEFKKAYPNKAIILVDGENFSWFGTRISKSASYFQHLKYQIEQQKR